jgi:hypothetical protein
LTIGTLTVTFWRPRGPYQWIAYTVAVLVGVGGIVVGAVQEHPLRSGLGMALVAGAYRIVDRIEELPR